MRKPKKVMVVQYTKKDRCDQNKLIAVTRLHDITIRI
jgi:hypothetical protein